MDLVLGNWGLNSKFQASPSQPITMYVQDFDQNNYLLFDQGIGEKYKKMEDKLNRIITSEKREIKEKGIVLKKKKYQTNKKNSKTKDY